MRELSVDGYRALNKVFALHSSTSATEAAGILKSNVAKEDSVKVLGFDAGTAIPRYSAWRRLIDELPLNHPIGSVILTTRAAAAAPCPADTRQSGKDVVRVFPSQPTPQHLLHSARIHLGWLSRALSTFPHTVRLVDLRGAVLATEEAPKTDEPRTPPKADSQAVDMALAWDNCIIITADDESPSALTIMAMPLHDREGEIIAAIDVTAEAVHLGPEHLLLFAQTAMAIEQHVEAWASPRVDASGIIGSMPTTPSSSQREEARVSRLLELAGVIVYVTDPQDRILHISERGQAEWGRDREPLVGKSLRDVFSEDSALAVSANSRKVRQARTVMQFEETVTHGGRVRTYLAVRAPLPAFRNRPDAVATVAIDTTGRHQAHEKAAAYAREMGKLIEAAPEFFAGRSVSSVLCSIADAARSLVGGDRATASIMSSSDVGRLLHATSLSEAARSTPAEDGVREAAVDALIYSVSKPVRQTVDPAVDLQAWGGSASSTARSEGDTRGWLAVPLEADESGSAGLIQAWHRPGKEFTDTDESVIVQLARLARIAIRNAAAHEQSETSERRKDEFLALLGHEMRNPLAPIRNATRLLEQADVSRENIQFARNVIDRQVDQMTRMVNDLLDMARLASGKFVIQKQPVRLMDVANRAVEMCSPLFDAKRQRLTMSGPDDEAWVDADAGRLGQVLANLLHNASKFTPENGEVALRVERREHEAVITVADTGQGIPVNMLNRIFGLFFQAGRPESGGPGLGLGLWLARNLVELQGGTISARSAGPGNGSEFVVVMPVLATPPASLPAEAQFVTSARERSSSGRSVLIVDDNKDSADSIAILLTAEGCSVRVAYNGAAALEMTATWSPDVIFLDIALPDMTGYAVIKKMRARETTKGSTIIAVTGWGRQRDREKTRAAGFDEHLVKPVDPAAIIGVVNARAQRVGARET